MRFEHWYWASCRISNSEFYLVTASRNWSKVYDLWPDRTSLHNRLLLYQHSDRAVCNGFEKLKRVLLQWKPHQVLQIFHDPHHSWIALQKKVLPWHWNSISLSSVSSCALTGSLYEGRTLSFVETFVVLRWVNVKSLRRRGGHTVV